MLPAVPVCAPLARKARPMRPVDFEKTTENVPCQLSDIRFVAWMISPL